MYVCVMIFGPFKADVHTMMKLKHECEKHKVCTNLGVAVYIYIYTTTTDHHHTVQVARVQVQYLRQWVDEKAPPAQVAEGDTTSCASGLSALVAE